MTAIDPKWPVRFAVACYCGGLIVLAIGAVTVVYAVAAWLFR